jgi:MoaA/NifB/PqqE/SkfB family radical SAM enzyme
MLNRISQELHYQHRSLRLGLGFFSRRLIHCNLQVTYRCNFHCQICDFWKEPHDPAEELTVEQIHTIGKKLNRLGTMVISLGGGEPLIRQDLYQVIAALNETHHFPILITNGWFVNETVAKEILRAGLQEISVSVDYADPARHDAQRGRVGAWDRAIKALELLNRYRPDRRHRVHMITVLADDNLEEVEPLLQLCRDLGVTYFITLYSSGRGTKPSRAPGGNVSDRLLELKNKYPEFISLTSYVRQFDQAIAEGGIGCCQAGTFTFNIGSRGEVSRCIDTIDDPVGNILTDEITDLRDRLQEARKNGSCADCWTSCRGSIESLHMPPRIRQFREFYVSVKRR